MQTQKFEIQKTERGLERNTLEHDFCEHTEKPFRFGSIIYKGCVLYPILGAKYGTITKDQFIKVR